MANDSNRTIKGGIDLAYLMFEGGKSAKYASYAEGDAQKIAVEYLKRSGINSMTGPFSSQHIIPTVTGIWNVGASDRHYANIWADKVNLGDFYLFAGVDGIYSHDGAGDSKLALADRDNAFTGDNDFRGGNALVAAPTADSNPATKKYADNIKNDIVSGATVAKKAEQDSEGNNISTTYIADIAMTYDEASREVGFTAHDGAGDPMVLEDGKVALPLASATKDGLMAKEDKTKLDAQDATIDGKISAHNQAVDAHSDIRADITALETGKADLVGGLVPAYQLPSYVDDVVEVATKAALDALETKETSKLYIVINDETSGNNSSTYRWTGSVFVKVSDFLSAAEIKTLYESNADTNAFTNALKSKLDGLLNGSQYYDKTFIDALAIYKGWTKTLLTPTPLVNGQTIATSVLSGKDKLTFICKKTSTGELDTDEVVGSSIVDGAKLVFFDTAGINLTVGAVNATFSETDDYELVIYGFNVAAQDAVDVVYDNADSGLESDNVQGAIDELAGDLAPTYVEAEHEAFTSGITATDVIEIIDDAGVLIKAQGNEPEQTLITNNDFTNGITGWAGEYASLSASAGVMTIAPTGGAGYAIAYENVTWLAGRKLYNHLKIRATTSNVYALGNTLYAGANVEIMQPATIFNPVQNQWYVLSGVYSPAVNGTVFKISASKKTAITNEQFASERIQVDYVKTYDITALTAQGAKNDSGVLFSALTDAEIKEQMDIWVENGFPTHINKIISKNDNLFSGEFKTLTSLESENLMTNGDLVLSADNITPTGYTYVDTTGMTLENGIAKFTATAQNGRLRYTLSGQTGNTLYVFARIKASSTNVKMSFGESGDNLSHSGSGEFELLSRITVITASPRYPYIFDASTSDWASIEVDKFGAINITDLVARGILPAGLTNAQYKDIIDNALFENVLLRESDFITVEPSVAYKLIKVSNNEVTHKLVQYFNGGQVVSVIPITYTNNKSQTITMNALTNKIKIVSDLVDRAPNALVNPDLSYAGGWNQYKGVLSMVNGMARMTADGTNAGFTLFQDVLLSGHTYYTKSKGRVLQDGFAYIRTLWGGYAWTISNPVKDTWYEFSNLATITHFRYELSANHPSAATTPGYAAEWDYAYLYDITQFKNAGVVNDSGTLFSRLTNEEIKSQMDLWVTNGFPDHVIDALYPDGADTAIAFKYDGADDLFKPQQKDELPLDLTLRSGEYWQGGYIVKQNGNAQASPLPVVMSAWNYGQIEAVYDSGIPADFRIKYAQDTGSQVKTAGQYLVELRERMDEIRTNQDNIMDRLGGSLFAEKYDSFVGVTSDAFEYYALEGIEDGNKMAVVGVGQSIENLLDPTKVTASQTANGLTITYDSETGVFTVNGTMTNAVAQNYILATGVDFGLPIGTTIQLMRYYESGTVDLNGSYIGYVIKGNTTVSNRINENSESLYDPYINASGDLTANHATNKQQLIFQVWKQNIVFTNFKFKIGIYEGLKLQPYIMPGVLAKTDVDVYNRTANILAMPTFNTVTTSGITIIYDALSQEFVVDGTASATKDVSLLATFAVEAGDRLSIKRLYQSGDITAVGTLPSIKLINSETIVSNSIHKMTAPEGETPTPDVTFSTGLASEDGTATLKLGFTSGDVFDNYRFRLMVHDKSTDIGYVAYKRVSVGNFSIGVNEGATIEFDAISYGVLDFVPKNDGLNVIFGATIADTDKTTLEYNAGIQSPNRKISILDDRITKIDNPFRDKVIAIWGDSRESNNPTSDPSGVGDQKDTSYPALLAKKLRASVLNFGLSGGAWAENTVQQDAASAIVNRVQTEDANASADVVIISSMNDFKLATPLGSPEPSNKVATTFYGAMRLTYDRLATKYPAKKIWLILPQKRFDESTNYGGGLYVAYRKAQIDVAREYGIPTIDLYNNFPNTKPTFYATNMLNDTHFSAVGNDLVAELVMRAMVGNGNSGADIHDPCYANIYLANNETVFPLVANTVTKITLAMTGSLASGITASAVNQNITILKTGIYQVSVNFGTKCSINNVVLDSGAYKNGSILPQVQQRRTAKDAGDNGVSTIMGIVSLVAGDILDFRVLASADCDITIRNASFNVVKL